MIPYGIEEEVCISTNKKIEIPHCAKIIKNLIYLLEEKENE
jgi:hypothetical protein